MIEISSLNPVHTVGDPDTAIGHFTDYEWWDLMEQVRHYGFEPPDIVAYYPGLDDPPLEIDTETSQELWEAISAAYHDDAVPRTYPEPYLGRLQVRKLMECAQIGAEHGGIEIRRVRDED